jgi:flagellar export protein FliJ
MNDRTATWKLLEELAVKSVVESRKQVGLATTELQRITTQKLQLHDLLDEYTKKLKDSQNTEHSINDNASYRHFINQVNDLINVLQDEQKKAESVLQVKEDELIESLKEQKKAEFLLSRQALYLKQKEEKTEQKQFDEIGVAQFNQRVNV